MFIECSWFFVDNDLWIVFGDKVGLMVCDWIDICIVELGDWLFYYFVDCVVGYDLIVVVCCVVDLNDFVYVCFLF